MRLIVESTDILVEVDGRECRLWRGTTEGGHPVDVYIHRIGSADPAALDELLAEFPGATRSVELADLAAAGHRAALSRN